MPSIFTTGWSNISITYYLLTYLENTGAIIQDKAEVNVVYGWKELRESSVPLHLHTLNIYAWKPLLRVLSNNESVKESVKGIKNTCDKFVMFTVDNMLQ